jgi:hypothetical protein
MEYYCTIGFYSFLAFQRHLICNISSYRTISMIFEVYLIFWKSKFENWPKLTLTSWLSWLLTSWWCQKSQQKKLIILRNFLYESCRELLHLSTLQLNLDSGQQGGLDLDYTLRDLKLRTLRARCSLNETRWDLRLWKAINERNNFRVDGATIRDHLRGRFGSDWLEIGSVSKI